MKIQSYLIGHGRAGQAIKDSIGLLRSISPELELEDIIIFPRGSKLNPTVKADKSILFIANPSGCHGKDVLSAKANGFDGIGCEKPVCTSLSEAQALQTLTLKGAVFHGYRQMWGIQELKKMLLSGEMGKLISIEGRYWQSSTADRALHPSDKVSWKNDPGLNGPSDTLLDIGTHWIDAAAFLADELPQKISGWVSYINAEASHRDSHAVINLEFTDLKAFSSVSKTVHGATNCFEISLIGSKKAAHWKFLNPDEIEIGEGKIRKILTRLNSPVGSFYPPFHSLGWMEGYMEIIRQLTLDVRGQKSKRYPTVNESAKLMELILQSQII